MVKKLPFAHILWRNPIFFRSPKSKRGKSPKTRQVEIDRSQFLDGYDPNIGIGYHKKAYKKLLSCEDASDPIAKIKHGKEAKRVFNGWLKTNQGGKGKGGKQKPYIYPELTKVIGCVHGFEECLLGASIKTKSGFKCRFLNKKGSDGYVHHVSVLANSVSKDPIHEKSLIAKVSQRKKGTDAYTISHLCGNGGCARSGHLIIEPKKINDERTMCHVFLRRCRSALEFKVARRLCPHEPKCFVNIYTGIKPYY